MGIMVNNTGILLIGILGVLSLVIFFLFMLLYSMRSVPKKPTTYQKGNIVELARESAEEARSDLQKRIFDKKAMFLIGVVSGLIGEFSFANVEVPRAILTVDGFMISFLIIAWSIIIGRPSTILSEFDSFKSQVKEITKNKELVEKLVKGEGAPSQLEGIRTFFKAVVTPIMRRGIIGTAFRYAIWSLVFSAGGSVLMLGFVGKPSTLSDIVIFEVASMIALGGMFFGMYILLKVFSFIESTILDREIDDFGREVTEYLASFNTDEAKS
jgi:hypothetical protein